MKKVIWILTALLLAGAAGGLYWGYGRLRARLAPIASQGRASQQDENSVPPPEPSLALLVNERPEAWVAAGGPLYLTVAVVERYAANVEAKRQLLRRQQSRLTGRGQLSRTD